MKSSHCSLIALLSVACLGVLLGAGDVIQRRPLDRGNDFALSLAGHPVTLSAADDLGLPSISANRAITSEAMVEVALPAGDFVFVQLMPSDVTGTIQDDAIQTVQVAIDAVSRQFPLKEAVPTHAPLEPGHYLMRLMHKEQGQARVFFEIK